MQIETCPLLGDLGWVRHGFYGSDNPHTVTNGLVGVRSFDGAFPRTLFLRQTHSPTVIADGDDIDQPADGAITASIGLALAVKTADCCPILLACTKTRQVAVVHAGWAGALNRITEHAVDRLVAEGASPATLIAAVGPSIAAANYPVQQDLYDKFAAAQPEALGFFHPFQDRWQLDVRGIIDAQLRSRRVGLVWHSDIDSYTHERYASYRQYHAQPAYLTQRNVSLIVRCA